MKLSQSSQRRSGQTVTSTFRLRRLTHSPAQPHNSRKNRQLLLLTSSRRQALPIPKS